MPRIIIEFDTMEDAENTYEELDFKLALALENILYENVIEGSDKIQAEQALNDYYKN